RPDRPLSLIISEYVQVRSGGEAEDHVLEVQEPAGDPPCVLRGGGPPVEVRGEPGGGKLQVAAGQAGEDLRGQGGFPCAARFPRSVAGLDEQGGHVLRPVMLADLEGGEVLQVARSEERRVGK